MKIDNFESYNMLYMLLLYTATPHIINTVFIRLYNPPLIIFFMISYCWLTFDSGLHFFTKPKFYPALFLVAIFESFFSFFFFSVPFCYRKEYIIAPYIIL